MKDSADIRKINIHKIRQILWKGDWKTKQQIALETGLSVATCNTLLNELANTGELISNKIRMHNVGPGALQFGINEDYEHILCVWFDHSCQHDMLTAKILSTTGKIKHQIHKEFDELTPNILQTELEGLLQSFSTISTIIIGTPSIAENGIIRHCDISALEGFPIVAEFSKKWSLPVYLENDMHFKVYGYAKMHEIDTDVVTMANFPIHILPGTATVHDGMVIKGHNQFAGMVGFLPFNYTQEKLLETLHPDTCQMIVSKSIISIISILNPRTIVLTGNLLNSTCIQWLYEDCKKWIPESYIPEIRYVEETDNYYLEGMYQKALELKGVF